MARFRLFDPVPQWRDALGNLIGSGGKLKFYDTGTTTPRAVYDAPTGGSSLGAELTIDSDGRLSEDFYLDGEYRVILTTSADVTVWQRDNVQDVATGGLQPPDAADGSEGQALFTDGTENGFYWDDVLAIPSMTGNQGKYLTNDGEALAWQAFAEEDTPAAVDSVASSSGSITIGGVMIQWGSDTAPTASSTLISTKAVTFGTAFSSTPYFIAVTPAVAGVTNNSPADPPSGYYTSPSSSGFTAGFFCGSENNAGTISITSTIPFTWMAIGPV